MALVAVRAVRSPRLVQLAPARGYSWVPFQPGHELSTTHGAYSPPLTCQIATRRA